ncbi:329_t:CDS:2, partial [Dentiscutata heterogama]
KNNMNNCNFVLAKESIFEGKARLLRKPNKRVHSWVNEKREYQRRKKKVHGRFMQCIACRSLKWRLECFCIQAPIVYSYLCQKEKHGALRNE